MIMRDKPNHALSQNSQSATTVADIHTQFYNINFVETILRKCNLESLTCASGQNIQSVY